MNAPRRRIRISIASCSSRMLALGPWYAQPLTPVTAHIHTQTQTATPTHIPRQTNMEIPTRIQTQSTRTAPTQTVSTRPIHEPTRRVSPVPPPAAVARESQRPSFGSKAMAAPAARSDANADANSNAVARPPPRRDLTWRQNQHNVVFATSPGSIAKPQARVSSSNTLRKRGYSSCSGADAAPEASLGAPNLRLVQTAPAPVRPGQQESRRGIGTGTGMVSAEVAALEAELEEEAWDVEEADLDYTVSDSAASDSSSTGLSFIADLSLGEENEQAKNHRPSRYGITAATLAEVKRKLQNHETLFWTYRLYTSATGEPVRRHYCKTMETSERYAAALLEDAAQDQSQKLLGFDIEWRPHFHFRSGQARPFKEEVSTIQLANEKRIVMFHIALHPGATPEEVVPPSLKRLLESAEFMKMGVNIAGDRTRLKKHLNLDPSAYFELSHLYKLVMFSQTQPQLVNRRPVRLAQQVQDILQLPLAKGDERLSDWSSSAGNEQVDYACSDAYAAVHLFDTLNQRRLQLKDVPPLPHCVETGLPIRFTFRTQSGEGLSTDSSQNDTIAETENATAAGEHEEGAEHPTGLPASAPRPRKPRQTPAKKAEPELATLDPKVYQALVAAREWASSYRDSCQEKQIPVRATGSQLMAYSLWHIEQFSVLDVAAHMSNRPIQTSTVSNYILEFLRLEKENAQFDKARLRDECLVCVPQRVLQRKYGSFLRKHGL